MKVCLSSRLPDIYLDKADEIKVQFRDRRSLPDFFDKFPDKNIILEMPFTTELDGTFENDLKNWNILSRGKLIVCIAYLEYANLMKKLNIPFYWGFKVQSYYQLQSLKNLGVCYVKLDAPLFFDLPNVKRMGIPIRAIPNVAYDDGMPRDNGVLGTWIRPEDIDAYDEYVDVIEFNNVELRQEQALYRIYMEDKQWPTELGLLVKDLNHIGLNRLIRSDISQRRISCGQRCQSGTSCRICYRMLDIANSAVLKDFADRIAKASLEEADN